MIKQTKYEFKRDVNELLHAFELAKSGEHESFISMLLSLLKIGCIQPILALLGANSIPKSICVSLCKGFAV